METVGMVHEDDVKVVITVAYDQVMDSNPEFLHKDPIFGHKNEAFGQKSWKTENEKKIDPKTFIVWSK